jgi:ankyrin repeat protein
MHEHPTEVAAGCMHARGVNLDQQSENDKTALQLAFTSGDGGMMALLLAHNADSFAGTGYPALPVSCLCQVTTFLAERMHCAACGHPLSPRLYLTYLCLHLIMNICV